MFFFFCKIGKQEGRRVPAQDGGGLGDGTVGTSGREEVVGKQGRRVNRVQILCTHVCKLKNATCQNCSRNPGRGHK
jgi:hypothetical protein